LLDVFHGVGFEAQGLHVGLELIQHHAVRHHE
jgi:hypothetical protein